jgi:hypothetical protein
LEESPESTDVLTVAGIIAFSNGRFEEARLYSENALQLDPTVSKASLTLVSLALYRQDFQTAMKRYEDLKRSDPAWGESYFLYLVGLELYKASGITARLQSLYDTQAKSQRRTDKGRFENAKKNAKMCEKILGKRLFQVSGPEKVVIPWQRDSSRQNNIILSLTMNETPFKLVLDTGNAVGWMVHRRDLLRLLNSKVGGRALTQIGMVSGLLYGDNVYSEMIAFDTSGFHHLFGMYVPKPHPSFYDANLNPIFLRNRVVTIDYLQDRVVLRTSEMFEEDLVQVMAENPERFVKIPFFGYERPLVPLGVEGRENVLCLFETGAEDITIRLDLAQELGLPLSPAIKYLASGDVFRYSKTPVNIQAGGFEWAREEAEVWPLDRFYDRLTGLSPDIVIGPQAFKDRYVLSFDPFKKNVIISDMSY